MVYTRMILPSSVASRRFACVTRSTNATSPSAMVLCSPPKAAVFTAVRAYTICALVFLLVCEVLGSGDGPVGSCPAGPTGRRELLFGATTAVFVAGSRYPFRPECSRAFIVAAAASAPAPLYGPSQAPRYAV